MNNYDKSVWQRLLPFSQKLVDTMLWDDFEFLYRNRHEFMELIRYNICVPVLLINKGKWINTQLHQLVQPYQTLSDIILQHNKEKIKISSICLSCLVPSYPSKRSVVLFNNLARIHNEPDNRVFPSIAGECIIVPYYDPSYTGQTVNNWPGWDITYFPSIFSNNYNIKNSNENKNISLSSSPPSPPSSPAFPTLPLPFPSSRSPQSSQAIPIPISSSMSSTSSTSSTSSSSFSPPSFTPPSPDFIQGYIS